MSKYLELSNIEEQKIDQLISKDPDQQEEKSITHTKHHLVFQIVNAPELLSYLSDKRWLVYGELNKVYDISLRISNENTNEHLYTTRKICTKYGGGTNDKWNEYFVQSETDKNKLASSIRITINSGNSYREFYKHKSYCFGSRHGHIGKLIGTIVCKLNLNKSLETEENIIINLKQIDKETITGIPNELKIKFKYKYHKLNKIELNKPLKFEWIIKKTQKRDIYSKIPEWITNNKELLVKFYKYHIEESNRFYDTELAGLTSLPSSCFTEDNFINEMNACLKHKIYYSSYLDRFYSFERLLQYDEHLYTTNENMDVGGKDFTQTIHVLWRYMYLRDFLLKGLEMNIYRSWIISPTPKKLQIGLISVILQLFLSIGLISEILSGYNGGLFQADAAIFIGSFLIFAFLSYLTEKTIQNSYQFYLNINILYVIPHFIVLADFISNVIVSLSITIIALLFLLPSESFIEFVLNSFALTFVIEIDDIANQVFEENDEYMIEADINNFLIKECPQQIICKYKFKDFLPSFLSPLDIFNGIWKANKTCFLLFWKCQHRKKVKWRNI